MALSPGGCRALSRFVHRSSERTVEPVRQDSSFAEKQESHPARLLIVRSGRLARGNETLANKARAVIRCSPLCTSESSLSSV